MALTQQMIAAAANAYMDESVFGARAVNGGGVAWQVEFLAGGIVLFDQSVPYPGQQNEIDPWAEDFWLWQDEVLASGLARSQSDVEALAAARAKTETARARLKETRARIFEIDAGSGAPGSQGERISLVSEFKQRLKEWKDARKEERQVRGLPAAFSANS